MAKRKRNSQRINVLYLEKQLREKFGDSVASLAREAGIAENTIYRALEGEPISRRAISQLCDVKIDDAPCIDESDLLSLGDQISLHSIKEKLGYDNNLAEDPIGADIDKNEQVSTEMTQKADISSKSSRPKILTFVSVKGGVGKTTLAVNTAVELAMKLRVALVDLDLFTFGATSWFKQSVFQEKSPLTFIDLALGTSEIVSGRKKLSIPIENLIAHEPTGELYFIPAFGNPNNSSGELTPPPILIDWSIDDARAAVDKAIQRLFRMKFDVIVIDSHPGFHSLTDTICNQADCNILVSDFDSSTLYANWILGWQIEHRHLLRELQEHSKDVDSQNPTWWFAINRIPSQQEALESVSRAKEVWRSALVHWNQCTFNSSQIDKVQTEFKEPVLQLPDMDIFRLDSQKNSSPTSFSRRGGTSSLIAIRSMIRRLVLEGVLDRFESDFPYADSDNDDVDEVLSNYFTSYAANWEPGWRGYQIPMGVPLFVSISFFTAILIIFSSASLETIQSQFLTSFVVGILILSLFNLWVYSFSWIIRELIRMANGIEAIIKVLSIDHLSRLDQLRLYDKVAKANRGVFELNMKFHFLWMLGFVPGAYISAMLLRGLGIPWIISNFVISATVACLIICPIHGKMKLIRFFFSGLNYLTRTILRKIGNIFHLSHDSRTSVDS